MPESFLAVDAVLKIYLNVASGLVVYDKVIHQRIMRELPFMATENIMMNAVLKGGDRQELHEKIRRHSMAAGAVVKEQGGECDLLQRIADDPSFGLSLDELQGIMNPADYVGRAPAQTMEYLSETVRPTLEKYKNEIEATAELNV